MYLRLNSRDNRSLTFGVDLDCHGSVLVATEDTENPAVVWKDVIRRRIYSGINGVGVLQQTDSDSAIIERLSAQRGDCMCPKFRDGNQLN